MSSKSLFSEVGDLSHGQPQPSGLASKRPRFNVSMYGSPVLVSLQYTQSCLLEITCWLFPDILIKFLGH